MGTTYKSEEKILNKVNTLSDSQMNSIQYFFKDNNGAHIATIPESDYNNNDECEEVLINANNMIFRYLNSGHTNIIDYLTISKLDGMKIFNDYIVLSGDATQPVQLTNQYKTMANGIIYNSGQNLDIYLPIEAIITRGASISIDTLRVNMWMQSNGDYIDQTGYNSQGYSLKTFRHHVDTVQPTGNILRASISKTSPYYNYYHSGSSMGVVPDYTPIIAEIVSLTYTCPSS